MDVLRGNPAALFYQRFSGDAGIAGNQQDGVAVRGEDHHVLLIPPHAGQVMDGHAQLGAAVDNKRRQPGFL